MDIAAAQEDWRFEFGWHAERRGRRHRARTGRPPTRRRRRHLPGGSARASRWKLVPRRAVRRLQPAAPEGLEGEFDDRIDPRFPVFSATSLAEALPGPLTPITLDVQMSGLRAASRVMGQVLALGGVVGDEWGSRAIAVFGHRPYVGVSANVVAAAQLPGWDQQTVAQRALGDQRQGTDLLPFGSPPTGGWAARFGRQSGRHGTVAGPVAPSAGRHAGLWRGRDGRAP